MFLREAAIAACSEGAGEKTRFQRQESEGSGAAVKFSPGSRMSENHCALPTTRRYLSLGGSLSSASNDQRCTGNIVSMSRSLSVRRQSICAGEKKRSMGTGDCQSMSSTRRYTAATRSSKQISRKRSPMPRQ